MPRMHKPRHHGVVPLRGIDHVPCSVYENQKRRFGRLFPNLPALNLPEDVLKKISDSMTEPKDDPQNDSPSIPAGFTFLGQFIDHDVTLDVVSSLDAQADPTAIENARTPLVELDSVYLQGLEASPYLYNQEEGHEGEMLTGTADNPDDLPRNSQGRALIGDFRNDENTFLSQLQLAFLRFHNAVIRLLRQGKVQCPRQFEDDFREAQRLVRWHYQWIVVNEYLPLIVDGQVLKSIWTEGLKLFDVRTPFMPVEFSVAAFRYGHTQIRSRYDVNEKVRGIEIFAHKEGERGLTSFQPLPKEFVVDWRLFFNFGKGRPQMARRLDTRLASEVQPLPAAVAANPGELALRNMLRAQAFQLPSGEAVACRLGLDPIPARQIGTGQEQNPLWFYILKEAELNKEDKLGAVGGRLVAETLIGLIQCDPLSYLSVAPCWKPCLPTGRDREFAMTDLISLAERFGK